jgi:hypothetical protein
LGSQGRRQRKRTKDGNVLFQFVVRDISLIHHGVPFLNTSTASSAITGQVCTQMGHVSLFKQTTAMPQKSSESHCQSDIYCSTHKKTRPKIGRVY